MFRPYSFPLFAMLLVVLAALSISGKETPLIRRLQMMNSTTPVAPSARVPTPNAPAPVLAQAPVLAPVPVPAPVPAPTPSARLATPTAPTPDQSTVRKVFNEIADLLGLPDIIRDIVNFIIDLSE